MKVNQQTLSDLWTEWEKLLKRTLFGQNEEQLNVSKTETVTSVNVLKAVTESWDSFTASQMCHLFTCDSNLLWSSIISSSASCCGTPTCDYTTTPSCGKRGLVSKNASCISAAAFLLRLQDKRLWSSLRKLDLIVSLRGSIKCHINFITIKFKCAFRQSSIILKMDNFQVVKARWELASCSELLPLGKRVCVSASQPRSNTGETH